MSKNYLKVRAYAELPKRTMRFTWLRKLSHLGDFAIALRNMRTRACAAGRMRNVTGFSPHR